MIDSRTEDVGCARLFEKVTGRFFYEGRLNMNAVLTAVQT